MIRIRGRRVNAQPTNCVRREIRPGRGMTARRAARSMDWVSRRWRSCAAQEEWLRATRKCPTGHRAL